MIGTTLTRFRWVAGATWAVSWFELYLEIFRFRHVALPEWVSRGLAFILLTAMRPHESCSGRSLGADQPFPLLAASLTATGAVVATLGLVNQLIWRPPFVVDLTLRRGNGGFVVLGLASVALGAALAHRRTRIEHADV